MEACEIVRVIVNKAIVPAEPKRRGNPGYGRVKALSVLGYPMLKRLENDTRIVNPIVLLIKVQGVGFEPTNAYAIGS